MSDKKKPVARARETGGKRDTGTTGTKSIVAQNGPGYNPHFSALRENIPQELQERPQWLLWQWGERKPDGGRRKPPLSARTGRREGWQSPETWTSFEDALAALEGKRYPEAVGVGFMATPETGLVFIDLDAVGSPPSELLPFAQDALTLFAGVGYAEISPSGRGLRIVTRGRIPRDKIKHADIEGLKSVELYSGGQYLTFTGEALGGHFSAIGEGQSALDNLLAWLEPGEAVESPQRLPEAPRAPQSLRDGEIVDKLLSARNADKVRRLIAESKQDAGHSASEAHLALAGMIAFYTPDAVQVARVLKSLGIEHEKMSREDYLARTAQKAVARVTTHWSPDYRSSPAMSKAKGNGSTPGGMATVDAAPTTWQPLPDAARLPEELGADASPWLDAYIAHSRRVSPRSWGDWHEAAGLFILSAVAARRVYLPFGRGIYPNVFIALIARTSLFSKTGVASLAESIIREAGLGHLLAPDISTPQKFLSSLSPRVPDNWPSLTPVEQEKLSLRLAFAAQRGWLFDEFGNQLRAMRNPNSVMADFARLLKVLDDNKPSYTSATISRGEERVDAPYLAFMGMGTPANIRELASKGGEWWNDGLFARFALLSPPPDAKGSRARWEPGEHAIETPQELIRRLREWDSRLGQPQIEILYREPDNPKRAGTYYLEASPPPLTPCTLGDGVYEAFYRYDDAMRDLLEAMPTEDLDGSYARMAEKALRVAILLASLENGGKIELSHWARAQAITERWRKGLHNLLDALQAAQYNEQEALEDRIIATVRKLARKDKPPTAAAVGRYIRGLSTTEAAALLEGLARAGALKVAETTHKGTKRYELP